VRINVTLIGFLYWSARVLAVLVFLFWGAFFLEHLTWFFKPGAEWPPAQVWLLQLAHLAMLIGLLVLLRWELAGSALTIIAALVFFFFVAGRQFPLFFAVTSLPAILALVARALDHGAPAAAGMQGPS
jgi:hypothetical protein